MHLVFIKKGKISLINLLISIYESFQINYKRETLGNVHPPVHPSHGYGTGSGQEDFPEDL